MSDSFDTSDAFEDTRGSKTVDDADVEQLTAYLDGELTDAETRQVEQRIATDTPYRLEMQRLQRTWDLLEKLPTEGPNASFTQTTMELIVDDARREVTRRTRGTWRRPVKWLVSLGLPLLLFCGGYWLTRQAQHNQIAALIKDLPVIAKTEHYLEIGHDIRFLEDLHRSGLFSDESVFYSASRDELASDLLSDPPRSSIRTGVAPADEKLALLESMDAEQRNLLREKRDRFESLSAEKKSALRAFHRELNQHSRSAGLRKALDDYYDWLATLSSTRQGELAEADGASRLKAIRETMVVQARSEFGRAGTTRLPSNRDAQAVFDWYEETTNRNRQSIINLFLKLVEDENIKEGRRVLPEKLEELKLRPLNQLVAVLISFDRDSMKEMFVKRLDALRNKLSLEAIEILDAQTENGRQELLLKWTEPAYRRRAQITVPQLQQFFETLTAEERDELDKMTLDNWTSTLTRRYREQQLSKYRETQLSKSAPETDFPEELFLEGAFSDEQGMQSLIEDSGLDDPPPLEDNFGITEEDMGMPPTEFDLEDESLEMKKDVELTVPLDLE